MVKLLDERVSFPVVSDKSLLTVTPPVRVTPFELLIVRSRTVAGNAFPVT